MVAPIECRYCGVEWDYKERRFAHREDCFLVTGVPPKVLGRKKIAPAKQDTVTPLVDLDQDFE